MRLVEVEQLVATISLRVPNSSINGVHDGSFLKLCDGDDPIDRRDILRVSQPLDGLLAQGLVVLFLFTGLPILLMHLGLTGAFEFTDVAWNWNGAITTATFRFFHQINLKSYK